MTCANCSEPALYLYDARPLRPTAYCPKHLPSFLRQSAKAGLLPVTDSYESVKREAFAALAPAPEEASPEEEKPAPKKRRRTKKVEEPTPEPDAVVEDPQEPAEDE